MGHGGVRWGAVGLRVVVHASAKRRSAVRKTANANELKRVALRRCEAHKWEGYELKRVALRRCEVHKWGEGVGVRGGRVRVGWKGEGEGGRGWVRGCLFHT